MEETRLWTTRFDGAIHVCAKLPQLGTNTDVQLYFVELPNSHGIGAHPFQTNGTSIRTVAAARVFTILTQQNTLNPQTAP
ncbi:hypothetical protein RYX36_026796 [Vicia faba]